MATGPDQHIRRLRTARLVSALTTVVAVAALATFATSGTTPKFSHTTVTKHTTVVQPEPATSVPAAPAPQAVTAAPVAAAVSAPVTDPATAAPTTQALTPTAQVAPAPAPATSPATVPDTLPIASPGTVAAPVPDDLPACPLPLNSPAQMGGLQTLIPFAPLFGPFSSEAFAMAPLFQPFMEAIGPFLIAFANAYGAHAPALAPLVAQVESFENEGFDAIKPLYGPYRTQFLAAESALATALAPYAKQLVDNAGASCVVDIESQLTGGSSATAQ